MAVMAVDERGLIVGTSKKRSSYIDSDSDSDSDSDGEGEVFFTPDSSTTWLQSPASDPLVCPLCPTGRGSFVDRRALNQHRISPAHQPRIDVSPSQVGAD